MEYLFIYLLQIFDGIENLQIFIGVPLFIGGLFYIIGKCQYLADERYYADLKRLYTQFLDKIFYTFLAIFIITFFIPTKQTLLLMGGTYYGKKAVRAVITDEKLKKVNTIIELELDKRIKDLQQQGGK